MKRGLLIILFVICAQLAGAKPGYPAFEPKGDPESLICDLEKSIAEQEKLLNHLRARYARIIARKKELSEWIEQEKEKLAQLQAAKAQPKEKTCKASLSGKKEDLNKLDRELQISLALEKKKGSADLQDINYLSMLIKKQKELCAEIIQLESDIASEEKILKQLRESRKSPAKS